jgi:hypothetical protein
MCTSLRGGAASYSACPWDTDDVIAVAVKDQQRRAEARDGAEARVPVWDHEPRDERIVVASHVPDARERGLQDQARGWMLEREMWRDCAAK